MTFLPIYICGSTTSPNHADTMKISQSLDSFLSARKTAANADLVDRWHIGMELQANMRSGDGEPIAGKKSTWSNGVDTWYSFRIPHKADSEPEWEDREIQFPLDLHCDGIGMTGWDWQKRCSVFVAFDFDGISGHAQGVGISDADLEKVKEAASALPYVETRRSTGGQGLHLYVYLDNISTANHTEHAALARCILGMMSSECNFDFAGHIDACGGVMWFWHRKMTTDNQGLSVIKSATKTLAIADLPDNWKDHIEVVSRKRAKVRINGVADESQFETLVSGKKTTPLDESHKAQIDELQRSGFSTLWISDHHLLQTHTKALASLMESTASMEIKGVFRTTSEGRNPGTPNCFLFPLPNGAWKVYRFSPGVAEAETWEQDSQGWTTCYFNQQPDLDTAARVMGGIEAPDNGGYVFESGTKAGEAVKLLGQSIHIPDQLKGREMRIRHQRDGRIALEVKKTDKNEIVSGWIGEKGKLRRLVNVKTEIKAQAAEESYAEYDKLIRTLNTPANMSAGWKVLTTTGDWADRTKDDIKSSLLAHGQSKSDADITVGHAVLNPWKLVNKPFEPEYPGDRQWNLDAAQLAFQPVEGEHPHWDSILQHCFCDLDDAIKAHPWCQKVGVQSGADYGRLWAANMLRKPFAPLPYLFLYGEENTGKSILHESLALLFTKGYASAKKALQSNTEFCGELANVILASVEEVDISKTPGALNKIKDWTTSPVFWVRRMRTDAYAIPNTLHFIQTANSAKNCPILPGDTRITAMYVSPLEVEIPKERLMELLKLEAPAFLYALFNSDLPEPDGRMRVPTINTDDKLNLQERNRPAIDQFILEHCHHIPGARTLFTEFCDRFSDWLPVDDRGSWGKRKIAGNMPRQFPVGISNDNVKWIGNLSWENKQLENHTPWVVVNGRLKGWTV